MAARTRFTATINDRYTRYGIEDLILHLYEYPVVVNNDYTVTGSRALDSLGNPISGLDEGDGQYSFSDVAYGEYVIIAYRPGIVPQIVNGYSRFIVLPRLAGDEVLASATDSRDIKTVINEIITFMLPNTGGWSGTPPTIIS
jgi:hypothetical protein